MQLVQLIDEDFVNYKKPSMVLGFPKCSFKCDRECGKSICQNSLLANSKVVDIDIMKLIDRYKSNYISKAIVMQGLEPFDSFDELYAFVYKFTEKSHDDIVIYTGYTEEEIEDQVRTLSDIIEDNNLIIKYGRFIPDSNSVYDEVLGVKLASDNQYAKVIVHKK